MPPLQLREWTFKYYIFGRYGCIIETTPDLWRIGPFWDVVEEHLTISGEVGSRWTVFRKKWIIRSCSRRAEEANRAEQWGDEMRLIVWERYVWVWWNRSKRNKKIEGRSILDHGWTSLNQIEKFQLIILATNINEHQSYQLSTGKLTSKLRERTWLNRRVCDLRQKTHRSFLSDSQSIYSSHKAVLSYIIL